MAVLLLRASSAAKPWFGLVTFSIGHQKETHFKPCVGLWKLRLSKDMAAGQLLAAATALVASKDPGKDIP